FQINDRIDGTATDGFEELKFLFQRNFTNKLERNGAALAVYYKGKLVVDLWGGWADRTNNKDWAKETLANIFSCTKSLAAICMAMKVHSKECDYSDKVTKFWPEFGKNGKEDITIDMILTHRAGLPYFEEELTLEDGADRGKISKTIEEEAPKYPPGSKIAYHPITFGWLIDQVFSRIDSKHRTIGEFLRDEVQQKHSTSLLRCRYLCS
ncbi:beta-lactamase, partial [Oesophagostomum dentatum]